MIKSQAPRLQLIEGDPEGLAPLWHRWRQQEQALRFNPFSALSVSQLAERIRLGSCPLKDANGDAPPRSIIRFARHGVSGEMVGQVNLHAINPQLKNAEIGYHIDDAHFGQGYATEMVDLFLTLVFQETEIRKIMALVVEENHASRRVLEKLGFQKEGVLREHYLIAGRPVNEGVYGLLKREWSSLSRLRPSVV